MVLNGLSFKIEGGEKIGIVGRTGAGKSTMSLAITRIVELEAGSIFIDGFDISELQIQKLRNKITIIPQDSSLFTGSLRMNIDPSGLVSDQVIIDLLHEAGIESLLHRNS